MFFDLQDVDQMEDAFDKGSERYDDGREPPGWATRGGFAVRIIARAQALTSANEAIIRVCLAHPAIIWRADIEKCPTRNALIELSRAFPSYSAQKKKRLCKRMRKEVPKILRASALMHNGMPDASLSDFDFVVRASRNHHEWARELCANCGCTHGLAVSFAIMVPCGHILCLSSQCLGSDPKSAERGCPICACELLFDGSHAILSPASSQQTRAIAIDTTLMIPLEILLACVAAMRKSC